MSGKRQKGRRPEIRATVLTIRLTARSKYLAELAAAFQLRTLSNFIEVAVEQALDRAPIAHDGTTATAADRKLGLWDADEIHRFVKLAQNFPELLDEIGQHRWRLICELGSFWHGSWEGKHHRYKWNCKTDSLQFPILREHWSLIDRVARRELSESEIPMKLRAPVLPDETIVYREAFFSHG